MSLNKSKGNMYKFITYTNNPLGGKCPHECLYCSTNKFYYPNLIKKYSGKPKLYDNALSNFGKDKFIFIVSQNDLFAEEIPHEFIIKILDHCKNFDNKYFFQTKNPKRLHDYIKDLPENSSICTTIESNRLTVEMGNSPHPKIRAIWMNSEMFDKFDKYVTIEPIMDFDMNEMIRFVLSCNPKQINIGADSGNNNLPEPSKEKTLELISYLKLITKVHLKKNLNRIIK